MLIILFLALIALLILFIPGVARGCLTTIAVVVGLGWLANQLAPYTAPATRPTGIEVTAPAKIENALAPIPAPPASVSAAPAVDDDQNAVLCRITDNRKYINIWRFDQTPDGTWTEVRYSNGLIWSVHPDASRPVWRASAVGGDVVVASNNDPGWAIVIAGSETRGGITYGKATLKHTQVVGAGVCTTKAAQFYAPSRGLY